MSDGSDESDLSLAVVPLAKQPITRQEAEASLNTINEARIQTRRALANGGGDLQFMSWGLLRVIGYCLIHALTSGFLPISGNVIGMSIFGCWIVLIAIGIISGVLIDRKHNHVKSPASKKIGQAAWRSRSASPPSRRSSRPAPRLRRTPPPDAGMIAASNESQSV
ncbi:MAG: hypothetical protein WCL39_10440 [Armatimonadota bacterium]